MGHEALNQVKFLAPTDVADVVSVLSEAFFDYPVMRFILGTEPDYSARLERLVTFFVMARVLRDGALLGVRGPRRLEAAALVAHPGAATRPTVRLPISLRSMWSTSISA